MWNYNTKAIAILKNTFIIRVMFAMVMGGSTTAIANKLASGELNGLLIHLCISIIATFSIIILYLYFWAERKYIPHEINSYNREINYLCTFMFLIGITSGISSIALIGFACAIIMAFIIYEHMIHLNRVCNPYLK